MAGPLKNQPTQTPQGMPRKGPPQSPPATAKHDQANGTKPPASTAGSYSGSFNKEQFSSGRTPKVSDNRLRMGN